ncbi:hypothetical protein [Coleofasciculus sp. E2-BRE-01]|uniref:hypothetical protein n=1 Tax=Coleofasciculus sp. E2-BRE-01 TaxID=3069524 RepID=UPI0032FB03C0
MTKTSALNVEQKPVQIPSGRVNLEGNLNMPEATQGVVIFAHGSGFTAGASADATNCGW